jgi:hypothetical protein
MKVENALSRPGQDRLFGPESRLVGFEGITFHGIWCNQDSAVGRSVKKLVPRSGGHLVASCSGNLPLAGGSRKWPDKY